MYFVIRPVSKFVFSWSIHSLHPQNIDDIIFIKQFMIGQHIDDVGQNIFK